MPDSPESSKGQLTVNTNTGSASGLNHSLKGPSALTGGMNGSHSPHSTMNGGSPPSPTTSLGNSAPTTTSNLEMPSACNVRQLSKLKRFLTTLQQFGSDISPEIGERVRTLILNLVNGTLTIEDFHHKLQETTNFPLRPFVVPFLKTNLPLLQRELIHGARLAKQSPQQYLRQHEHLVLDPSHSPTEASDIFHSEINENGKRRTPDSLSQHSARVKENGSVESSLDMAPPPKRHHSLMSPPIPNRMSPGGMSLHPATPLRLEDVSLCRDLRDRDRERYEFRHYGVPLRDMLDEREMEDEWKNIHTMLNCILGMVEKTKRALAILQHRSLTDRHEMALWIRRHSEGTEHDMKKRAGEMMAHTLKTTEDRVSEVKRRAEEAVNEVKRQAVVELQKAVSAAEAKASELVAAERAKMEKLIMEARRQATEEALSALNRQEDLAGIAEEKPMKRAVVATLLVIAALFANIRTGKIIIMCVVNLLKLATYQPPLLLL
uniref:TAFH domain-containing protein n=1 Tax=Strigamia maritima TaxID=126957 RepID=T1J868_STRMM